MVQFSIYGSSNAIRIHMETPQHPAFKEYNTRNYSLQGATVNLHHDNCFIYQKPVPAQPHEHLFVFNGPNGYPPTTEGYHRYLGDYSKALRRFAIIKQVPKHRIVIVLSLPRWNEKAEISHGKQMNLMKNWGLERKNEGFGVIYPYGHISDRLREPSALFSRNDKGRMLHFSASVRQRLNRMIGRKMADIADSEMLFNEDNILNL